MGCFLGTHILVEGEPTVLYNSGMFELLYWRNVKNIYDFKIVEDTELQNISNVGNNHREKIMLSIQFVPSLFHWKHLFKTNNIQSAVLTQNNLRFCT